MTAADLVRAVPDAEFARFLRLPPAKLAEERLAAPAASAREWYARHGRPWTGTRELALRSVDEARVELETGTVFASRALARRLRRAEATALVAVAVTAGPEVDAERDRLWKDDRPDEAFYLHALASAVTVRLMDAVRARVCEGHEPAGQAVLPHFCPGYEDWGLGDQPALGSLLGGLPIRVLESGALSPTHSLLGVMGLTARQDLVGQAGDLSPCASCSFTPCAYRRRPYRPV